MSEKKTRSTAQGRRGRKVRGRGLVPPDDTVRWSIFREPLAEMRKRGIEIHQQSINPDTERNLLLEEIRYQRELLRREYRDDLFLFARDVLGYDKMERDVHGELCQRLMDAYYGRGNYKSDENYVRRYLFLLPRGTFKTTIATIAFPIWIFIQDDPPALGTSRETTMTTSFNGRKGYNQRILMGSEVDEHSVKFHQNIKDHLVGTEPLRDFFGNLAPEKRVEGVWTKKQSNVTWRMDFRSKETNITTTSMDSTINSGHYDIGIFDDMISEKQVSTDEQIQQSIEWYRRLLPIMMNPDPTLIIFIGTRWHDKDLYGHFIEEEGSKWQVYREAAERTDEEVKAGKRRYFFPSLLGKEVLEDLRSSMRPYIFSCQYYNDPIAATDALFKKEYFESAYYTLPAGEHLQKFLENKTIITTVDPATSKEKSACNRVVTTWAWDHKGVGWCLDLYREREANPADWMKEVFRQYKKWRPISVGIEQLDIYQFAADQMSQIEGLWPPLVALKPSKRQKEMRISGLEPLARAGRLKLQREHAVFEEEALRFPRGRYKDALDATAYQLDLAFSGSIPPEPVPEEGSPAFIDALIHEVQEKRLARLRIGGYGADDFNDWYNS